MLLNLTRWDSADHPNTTEDIAACLEAAFDDGDSARLVPRGASHPCVSAVRRCRGQWQAAE